MTDNEIKIYIENAVKEAIAASGEQKAPTPRLLAPTHEKWFKADDGSFGGSKMGKAFAERGYKAYTIWDKLRSIAVSITGKSYVRHIAPQDMEKVNEIADRLCQCVYECRQDWIKYKQEQK